MKIYCQCGHSRADHNRKYGCGDTDCYCARASGKLAARLPKGQRGLCSVCGNEVAIRTDGTLRGHGAASTYSTRREGGIWCQGSHELPGTFLGGVGARFGR